MLGATKISRWISFSGLSTLGARRILKSLAVHGPAANLGSRIGVYLDPELNRNGSNPVRLIVRRLSRRGQYNSPFGTSGRGER